MNDKFYVGIIKRQGKWYCHMYIRGEGQDEIDQKLGWSVLYQSQTARECRKMSFRFADKLEIEDSFIFELDDSDIKNSGWHWKNKYDALLVKYNKLLDFFGVKKKIKQLKDFVL